MAEAIARAAGRPAARRRRRLRYTPGAIAGLAIVLSAILVAIAAPSLAPRRPEIQVLAARLTPPAWAARGDLEYPLGTDQLGRDLLSRVIHGSRISLLVAPLAVAIGLLIGVPLGLISGYFGGRLDDVIMRLGDIQLSIPFILLVIAVITVVGPGLTNTIAVLGVASWVTYARVLRGEVLSLRERDYVAAARALGATDLRVVLRHLLPNTLGPLIVVATLELARIIVVEAALSFLGLTGLPPELASWGTMLADGREVLFFGGWWVSTFPGIAITLTVLGINLVGDWLRDEFDPRSR
jgi:peptide/nickel transport system permease protein